MDLFEEEIVILKNFWADPKNAEAMKKVFLLGTVTAGVSLSVIDFAKIAGTVDDILAKDDDSKNADDPK